MEPDRWHRARHLVASQHGVVALKQLLDAGFSERAVSRAVSAGMLVRVFRGVFALGPLPGRDGLLRAALLGAGPEAAVSNRPAASVLEMLPWNGRTIDLTVPTRNGQVGPDRIRIHRGELPPDQVWVRNGLRLTSASRTIVDIAGSEPAALERVIREASGCGLLSVEGIEAVLATARNRPGTRALRQILRGEERVPPFSRSRLERRMHSLCKRAGLEVPQMNVEIPTRTEVYEVDFVWARERLIVECDSRWHDNPFAATKDAERTQELTLAGFRVYRVRWAQIVRAPERVAESIATLLDSQRLVLGLLLPVPT
jgi:very-short-patch-repair endonuclease